MNRFFRTAYSATLIYLGLSMLVALITGVGMPFPAFSCLYIGLLIALLPLFVQKTQGGEKLFLLLGFAVALFGFVPVMLFRCPITHYFVHGIGIVGAILCFSLLRHRTTHSIFLAKFRFTFIAVTIVIGLVYLLLAGSFENGFIGLKKETVKRAMNAVIPIAIVMLVTGVLHLRGLRARDGAVDERAFTRRQLRDTLIFFAVVSIVFLVDPFLYMGKAFTFLIDHVLRPAGRLLYQAGTAFVKLISCSRPQDEEVESASAPSSVPVEQTEQTAPAADPQPQDFLYDGPSAYHLLAYIFIGIAAAILLVILAVQIVKLVKKLRDRTGGRGQGYPHEIRETLPKEVVARKEDRPKRSGGDARERIRYLYAEFLRYLKRIPGRIGRTQTCREIERHAEAWLHSEPADVSDLTELYEKARYCAAEVPTEADAKRMKSLLQRIRQDDR